MHFGIFLEERRRGVSEGATLRETLELADAGEAGGLDGVWLGEIHFNGGRSIQSAPLALARFLESLEIIRLAWKGQPFSYDGKFYRFQNVTVSPTPYQVPHPPLRMAANSPETFPQVASLGLPLFIGLRDLDIPAQRGHLRAYREAWREAGHPGEADIYLRIPVYAAPTEQAAREEPRAAMTYFFERHVQLVQSGLGRGDTGPLDRRQIMADRIAAMPYEEVLKTRVAFGTAASLRERLGEIAEDLGLSGIVAELNPSGLLSLDQMRRTLDILTREVIPTFR